MNLFWVKWKEAKLNRFLGGFFKKIPMTGFMHYSQYNGLRELEQCYITR